LTPGAFILESGLHALGCPVVPGGVGNTEMQVEAIAQFRPVGYTGTPDFLKVLLDAARTAGKDVSSLKRALVSGAALPPSLRAELGGRGVDTLQCYALGEVGVLAYETPAREGMLVNEHVLVEIVRPGTGAPVADGDVGEVVVTCFNADYPMIRLATGDLSAVLPGRSPCGRTNMRIKGWMGRADQTTKVKGMFVHPGQVAEVARRHPTLGRVRLAVTRADEQDAMTLSAECAAPAAGLAEAVAATLQSVTKGRGEVKLVAPGTLPNDGKGIADERGGWLLAGRERGGRRGGAPGFRSAPSGLQFSHAPHRRHYQGLSLRPQPVPADRDLRGVRRPERRRQDQPLQGDRPVALRRRRHHHARRRRGGRRQFGAVGRSAQAGPAGAADPQGAFRRDGIRRRGRPAAFLRGRDRAAPAGRGRVRDRAAGQGGAPHHPPRHARRR